MERETVCAAIHLMIHLTCFPPLLDPLCIWISIYLCLRHFFWLSLSQVLGASALKDVRLAFGHCPEHGVRGVLVPRPCCSQGRGHGTQCTPKPALECKDTEEEPLCSPVAGLELSLCRRRLSLRPVHHPIAGVLPHSGFAERGDGVPKPLQEPRGV